jgi:hypothetical protein
MTTADTHSAPREPVKLHGHYSDGLIARVAAALRPGLALTPREVQASVPEVTIATARTILLRLVRAGRAARVGSPEQFRYMPIGEDRQ